MTLESILVVQPDLEGPPERFGQWFEREGFRLQVVRPFAGDRVPATLEHDALVVLGGDMGASDLTAFPWLGDIMELLRVSVAQATPTLGICLGGQLLAASFGGTIKPGPSGMEAGAVEVYPTEHAQSDALVRDLPWPLRMITMHRDAITELPPDAVWLARSEPYGHQAFRLGSVAWGVQFHPEASPSRYEGWAAYVKDEGEAMDRVRAGIAEVHHHDDQIVAGADALAKAFAELVRDAGQRPPRAG